jgi:hypothetical protein
MHAARRYFDFTTAGHRVTRIDDEVQNSRLELRWVDTDGINCGIEVEFEDDRLPRGSPRELFEVEENSIWI